MDEPTTNRSGHPELVTESELMEWAETKRREKLIRWLGSNGIRFDFSHKGHVCTTIAAINASLLGTQPDEEIEFL